jgi:PAS domain-containing protein
MEISQKNMPKEPFWRAIFDALPLPAFIVDEDVRILDFNPAAEKLLGTAPKSSLWRRGGEVLHCVYAERVGCGKSKPCKTCIVRNSVKDAIQGLDTRRKYYHVELLGSRGAAPVNLFVTTHRLPGTETPQALLILENVGETLSYTISIATSKFPPRYFLVASDCTCRSMRLLASMSCS